MQAANQRILRFHNTVGRQKVAFTPIDPANVRMYVCGPTVYDAAHIGNARPLIVFDLVFRLLRYVYGADHVTYARNITDIDDKINKRAVERFPELNPTLAIRKLTEETAADYHQDIGTLGLLQPTIEPRATDHIAEMVVLCNRLVASGNAYVAEDHVLFSVPSMAEYGTFSGRSLEEMEAGARVEVAPYKRNPMDFVLWKPSAPGEPGWPSPNGISVPGRPGWHIECSAMAWKHLGTTFDIHGGGIDLIFPHHENEVAQSCCAHHTPLMASLWMHNGFLEVEGEKMSKSLGNFITIRQMVASEDFGGRRWHGLVFRLAMLGTHYRQPIDMTIDRMTKAKVTLQEFADLVQGVDAGGAEPNDEVLAALADDLNTPSAMSILHALAKSVKRNGERAAEFKATLSLMGVLDGQTAAELDVGGAGASVNSAKVDEMIAARLTARRAKDFKESDRLRDAITAMGVALKDAKDPATGELVTTWEVKR